MVKLDERHANSRGSCWVEGKKRVLDSPSKRTRPEGYPPSFVKVCATPHELSADEKRPVPSFQRKALISIQKTTKIIRELFVCMLFALLFCQPILMLFIRFLKKKARYVYVVCTCTDTRRMHRPASFVCRCMYEEFAE